jgi:hypothetical protein
MMAVRLLFAVPMKVSLEVMKKSKVMMNDLYFFKVLLRIE